MQYHNIFWSGPDDELIVQIGLRNMSVLKNILHAPQNGQALSTETNDEMKVIMSIYFKIKAFKYPRH